MQSPTASEKFALPAGTVLDGHYVVERVLGAGGFAKTYLARDQELNRLVAIKEFYPSDFAQRIGLTVGPLPVPEVIKTYTELLMRFEEEARVLAKVRHANVVRVHRSFPANGTHYIDLEYIDGVDFDKWLDELAALPSQAALDQVVRGLLDALEEVHKAGILHRDVTPKNIRLRHRSIDGVAIPDPAAPVLLDFGSHKTFVLGDNTARSRTVAIGTFGYAALEALSADAKKLGPWSDIYGLAATLYRALNREKPLGAFDRVLNDDLIPAAKLPALGTNYRAAFLGAIDHGLAVKPEGRPQTISAWRAELFDGTTLPPVKTGRPTTRPVDKDKKEDRKKPPPPRDPVRTEPVEGDQVSLPPRRRGGAGLAAGVGGLLVLGGAGVVAAVMFDLLPKTTPPKDAPQPPTVVASQQPPPKPGPAPVPSPTPAPKVDPPPTPKVEPPRPPAPAPKIELPPPPAPKVEPTPPPAPKVEPPPPPAPKVEPPPPPAPKVEPPPPPAPKVEPPPPVPKVEPPPSPAPKVEQPPPPAPKVEPPPPPPPAPPPRAQKTWAPVVAASEVAALAASVDGRTVLSGGLGGRVQVWDVTDRGDARPRIEKSLGTPVRFMALAPSGSHMAVVHGSPGTWTVSICDIRAGGGCKAALQRRQAVEALAYSPVTQGFVTVSTRTATDPANPPKEARIERWSLDGSQVGAALPIDKAFVYSAAVSRDGRTVAAALRPSSDGRPDTAIVIYDLAANRTVRTIPTREIALALAFAPDGRLAYAEQGHPVKLVDPSNDGSVVEFRSPAAANSADIVGLSFSDDGKWLAGTVATPGAITVWEVARPAVARLEMQAAVKRYRDPAFLRRANRELTLAYPFEGGVQDVIVSND